MLQHIKPKNVLPTHSNFAVCGYYLNLLKTLGFKLNYNYFLLENQQSLNLNAIKQ